MNQDSVRERESERLTKGFFGLGDLAILLCWRTVPLFSTFVYVWSYYCSLQSIFKEMSLEKNCGSEHPVGAPYSQLMVILSPTQWSCAEPPFDVLRTFCTVKKTSLWCGSCPCPWSQHTLSWTWLLVGVINISVSEKDHRGTSDSCWHAERMDFVLDVRFAVFPLIARSTEPGLTYDLWLKERISYLHFINFPLIIWKFKGWKVSGFVYAGGN